MVPVKIVLMGIVLMGMLGAAGAVVLAASGAVVSEARDILPRWGGWGGGCHGYDSDDGGNSDYPYCHRGYDDDDRSCTANQDCPYYDNRTA